jgi:tRNA(Ile)-lysidine synthase
MGVLPDQIQRYIATHHMLAPGARVLVACSGGGDSMALLHALRALQYDVEAAHVDHGLRGAASTADRRFVEETCARLGIACHSTQVDTQAAATASGASLEMAARALRYSFLLETARARGIAVLATGHTQEDQAETVLLRLIQGAGPAGLAGIPPIRQEDQVCIVRPLLACRRDALRAWLRAQGHAWREDASNEDCAIPRNWVRHVLLPKIAETAQPRIVEALARTAEMLRADQKHFDVLTKSALEHCLAEDGTLKRAPFAALSEAVQRRVMQHWLRDLGVEPDHETILRALDFVRDAATGTQFDPGRRLLLHAGRSALHPILHAPPPAPISLMVPGTARFGDRTFRAEVVGLPALEELRACCSSRCQYFDADALGTALTLRTRRRGDRFVPLGMRTSRKLQDYFVDRGVPAPLRDQVPIVEAQGEIAWIVGHAPAAPFAITAETRRAARITVSDESE